MNGESQTAADPGKGVCGGVKIFGCALLRPARSVFVSLSAFFIFKYIRVQCSFKPAGQ